MEWKSARWWEGGRSRLVEQPTRWSRRGSSSLSCSSSSPFFFEIFVHPPAAADAGLVHGVAVDDYIGNFRWLEAAAPNACCKKTCSISGGDFQQIAVGVGGYGFIVSLSGEAGPAYDADS